MSLRKNNARMVEGSTVYTENVQTMKSLTYLKEGDNVETRTYHSDVKGGGASYTITTSSLYGGSPDGFGDHLLDNGNVAVLTVKDSLCITQFGAVPHDASKAGNNLLSIRACILYAFNNATPTLYPASPRSSGNLALQYNTPIVAPAGEFLIDGNSPFRVDPDLLEGNSLRRGLRISGAGKESTVFTLLSSPTGSQNRWFYDTEAFSSQGGIDFLSLRDMTWRGEFFETGDNKDGNGWNSVSSGSKIGAFRCYATGFEKFFDIENMMFVGMDDCILFDGNNHGASNHFRSCYFKHIRNYVMKMSNDQSIAHQFTACDFEFLNGDLFVFDDDGGGYIKVDGGSVILEPKFVNNQKDSSWTTEKAVFKYHHSSLGTSALRNAKHMIKNVTFEIYDDLSQLLNYSTSSSNAGGAFSVTAEDCSFVTVYRKDSSMGGSIPIDPSEDPVNFIKVSGNIASEINLIRCHLNSHHKYTTYGATNDFLQQTLLFDSCRLLWVPSELDRSLASLTSVSDNASARGINLRCAWHPTYTTDNYTNVALDFDSNYSKVVQYVASPKRALIKPSGRNWNSSKPNRCLLPPSVFITKLEIHYPSNSGTASDTKLIINNGINSGETGHVQKWVSPEFSEADGLSTTLILDPADWLHSSTSGYVGVEVINNTVQESSAFISVEYL